MIKRFEVDLISLLERFGDDEACRRYLEALRWREKVSCPRCQSEKISHISTRDQFDCDSCRYQFSVTAGSIFHDSHLPLRKWFLAVYLMCESKKGMSANQLKRTLKINYKTAWYLCHRIRKAMVETNPEALKGTVEVDETYVGGHRKHVVPGYRGNKTMVLGALERGGEVRLRVERRYKEANKKLLHGFVKETVSGDAKRIMTDQEPDYNGIADENTTHETVNHRADEWVRGDVHTNGIDNVWSLLKRSIIGTFHQVSAKHLDSYVDELEWRFNNRHNAFLFRDTIAQLLTTPKMQYKELIEKSA